MNGMPYDCIDEYVSQMALSISKYGFLCPALPPRIHYLHTRCLEWADITSCHRKSVSSSNRGDIPISSCHGYACFTRPDHQICISLRAGNIKR